MRNTRRNERGTAFFQTKFLTAASEMNGSFRADDKFHSCVDVFLAADAVTPCGGHIQPFVLDIIIHTHHLPYSLGYIITHSVGNFKNETDNIRFLTVIF
jgi:hypothetical protein